ncbi:MAG: class 1 fructose-bisphosphatase [Bernardetiaceae bacterium]|nr:class 1 fructose-bisphosphatase [Bernardetiaceae bacterium]
MQSVTEFLDAQAKSTQEAFAPIIHAITEAAITVSHKLQQGSLTDIYGAANSENVQGETQQKLDIIANELFIQKLEACGKICLIASEENEDILHTPTPSAPYALAMDPLDGSSNIDVNVSVGTIFGIYQRQTNAVETPTEADILQAGKNLKVAGYVLYGTATVMVVSFGSGTFSFTLNPETQTFIGDGKALVAPAEGKTYSCNEGGMLTFPNSMQAYLKSCKAKNYKARYIGSLVADFHRNLIKGGVFLYPQTESAPQGKLRLLYECAPLAFIAEQAEAAAISDKQAVLDIIPEKLHQRIPYIVGSSQMVEEIRQLIFMS